VDDDDDDDNQSICILRTIYAGLMFSHATLRRYRLMSEAGNILAVVVAPLSPIFFSFLKNTTVAPPTHSLKFGESIWFVYLLHERV
jgi:hypothetical protein